MLRLLLSCLLMLTVIPSCHRFEQKFDGVGALCDFDPASMDKDDFFVKLEDPDGRELSATQLLTIRSRYVVDGKESLVLTISRRGCMHVPPNQGVLQALSADLGWNLAQRLDSIAPQKFLRLRMNPAHLTTAELQCPGPVFFANEYLPFPLRWTTDGPLNAEQFTITAERQGDNPSVTLFSKPYGVHLTELPKSLDTRTLPEGSYQLRLQFQSSTYGWDLPGFIPAQGESCSLTVLHRPPSIGGLNAYELSDRVAVFARGDILPWKTQSEYSDLLYCRESRSQLPGTQDDTEGCSPRAQCQDPNQFQRTGAIVADEVGVFDYFALAEDRTGHRSPLSCQTLVVSSSEPRLELRWTDEDWNKPAAQMPAPRAGVRLQIHAQHPQVPAATLASRLQCRAEFVRQDQAILSGRTIHCETGRCRGRTMENFVPCDADTSLSLAKLWPQMKEEGGVLRVFVRTDDRAGHPIEQSITLGIEPQRWKPTRLSRGTTLEDLSFQLLQNKQGHIVSATFRRVSLWNDADSSWQDVAIAGASSMQDLKLWQSTEQDIYVQWTMMQESGALEYHYARFVDQNFVPIASPDGANGEECVRAHAFQDAGFWCETKAGFAIYTEGRWSRHELPLRVDEACAAGVGSQYLARDAGQNLWLSCDHRLYRKAAGQTEWVQETLDRPLASLGLDRKARLWLVEGSGRDDLRVSWIEAGQKRVQPNPEGFGWLDLKPQEFSIGPAGEVIFGTAYWDDAASNWRTFSYWENRRSDLRVWPRYDSQGELYWESEQGLWQWDGHGLRLWDLSLFGLKLSTSASMQAVFDTSGAPWILASPGGSYEFPFRFQLRSWLHFAKPGQAPSTGIAGLWVDPARSMPQVYLPHDGLYALDDGGWNLQLNSPAVAGETPLESESFAPFLLSSDGVYHWDAARGWFRLTRFSQPTWYWGGTLAADGRYWVYSDTNELGLIRADKFESMKLPSESGSSVAGIFRRHDQMVVATEIGISSYSSSGWQVTSWQSLGLTAVDRVRQLDDDSLVISVTDDTGQIVELWLLDLKSGVKKALPVPEQAYFLGGVKRNSKGEIIMAIKFDIYRTDGEQLVKVFTEKDLYSLPKVTGTFLQIRDLQLDDEDRIWFHTGLGVVRVDP